MTIRFRADSLVAAICLVLCGTAALHGADATELATALAALDARVFPEAEREAARRSLADHQRALLKQANERSSEEWRGVRTLEGWQSFREVKIKALQSSLGLCGEHPPANIKVVVARQFAHAGVWIENVLYESRPGLWVSANLYRPVVFSGSRPPGLILSHSHHSPKSQGELQDMGLMWARAGCVVLVPDHLGHGERRQHPFATAADYPQPFKVDRQDYYFRYDTSLQLYLAGESLMGQLAWDLMAGVSVLLEHAPVDPDRLIILGGVAGGGDPAAVTAALDERIDCAVVMNFGGPQPETKYPLPEDAESTFDYAGSGSWESTRNLRNSAKEGFLPWVIVGSIAPRRLVYGHEFTWDRERDPVWKRLEQIWAWHKAPDRLGYTHGAGSLRGSPPESTHCGNIGPEHRVRVHAHLKEWFGIQVDPIVDKKDRLEARELLCWTDALRTELKPRFLREILRESNPSGTPFGRSLGNASLRLVVPPDETTDLPHGVRVERRLLRAEDWLRLPVISLHPKTDDKTRPPVVLGLSMAGKEAFLKQRSAEIASLLQAGLAVCLVDVRGTGELAGDTGRGAESEATSQSATALMLGEPLADARYRDWQTTLTWLAQRWDVDGTHVGLWAESFARVNDDDRLVRAPRRIERGHELEPLPHVAAIRQAAGNDRVKAVYSVGGLCDFSTVFDEPFAYIPHDAVGNTLMRFVAMGKDSPTFQVRLECLMDGQNRLASLEQISHSRELTSLKDQLVANNQENNYAVGVERSSPLEWMKQALLDAAKPK